MVNSKIVEKAILEHTPINIAKENYELEEAKKRYDEKLAEEYWRSLRELGIEVVEE